MKIECYQVPVGGKAIFLWNQTVSVDNDGKPIQPKLVKMVKELSKGDTFEIGDDEGHEVLAKYKGLLRVVHYGDGPAAPAPAPAKVDKALDAAPKNVAVKDEKVK